MVLVLCSYTTIIHRFSESWTMRDGVKYLCSSVDLQQSAKSSSPSAPSTDLNSVKNTSSFILLYTQDVAMSKHMINVKTV